MIPAARTWLPIVAAAAAGLALGWLAAQGRTAPGRLVGEPGTIETPSSEGPPTASSATAASLQTASPAVDEAVVAARPRSAADAPEASPLAPDAPLPMVEVQVRNGDGTPAEGADVYALPAGADGDDDDEDAMPAVGTDESGTARLLLPAEGTYDVGASYGVVHALALDVSSSAGRLEIALPRLALVEFLVDDRVRRRLRPPVAGTKTQAPQIDQIQFLATPVDDRPGASRPGRRQSYSTGSGAVYAADAAYVPQATMPEGRPCRVTAHGRFPLRVEPDVVVPPATVRVVLAGCGLGVTVAPVKGDRTFDYDATVSLELRIDGRAVLTQAWRLAAGQPCSALAAALRVASPSDEGRLEWSGQGVVPGSTSFRAGPDGEAVVRVALDVTSPPPAPPSVDDPPRRMRVRLVAPEGPRVESVSPYHVRSDGDVQEGELEWDDEADEGTYHAPEDAESVLAFADLAPDDDEIFELVAGPSRGAHDGASLTFVRGGFLVLVPERPTPSGLHLTLRRSDGLPFHHASSEDSGVGIQALVSPGTVLGPLQPGTARFALRLGGASAGEVSAQVVAGEYRPLFVPVRRAPTR